MGLESYCDCYAIQIGTLPEDDRDTVLEVSQVIANLREERGLDVESAADLIDANPQGSTHGVSTSEFELTGEFVDSVRTDMRANDGVCPAA
ncbi:MAG: hypothetical protein WA989_01210 [Henriciella sp.]|uniref:hypothetical protein n=1 Tax=Henriciella sp. TaxID=1968823 RepID=UPI003C73606A